MSNSSSPSAAARTVAVDTAQEPPSAGSVTRTPRVRAHGERLAQRLGGVRRRHRQERDLALAGGLDELERRLEDVLVVAVDDRRDGRAIEPPVRAEAFTGGRRVRNGLHQDDDAHEVDFLLARSVVRPSKARATTSRWICWVPS